MSRTVAFTCRNCGSPTAYEPAGLTCVTCGLVTPVEPRPLAARRRALRPVFAEGREETAAEIPDELEYQLQCPQCGGGATYGGTLRAHRCPFCAAPVALADVHESGGRLPIDGIIPFQVDENTAHRSVRRWLARAWFAPRGMRLHARATHYARVYVPVLTIDAQVEVEYESYSSGLRSDLHYVSGEVRDVVISAGSRVDQQRLEEFRPWPMHLMVAYRPEYLAGAFCESYDHTLPTIRSLVHEAFQDRGRTLALAALRKEPTNNGKSPILVSSSVRSSMEGYRHVLVPVFLVTTRLRKSVRQVVVSGIDGTIRAHQPVSAWKVGLWAGSIGGSALAWPWLKDTLGM